MPKECSLIRRRIHKNTPKILSDGYHLLSDKPYLQEKDTEQKRENVLKKVYPKVRLLIAGENIRFSSLFAAGDVSRRGTAATPRQKFYTDDANQCLLNKSGSRGVPNVDLFNFRFLLIDFGKVLCSSANELQQNSNACCREDYIPQILTVLLEIHRVYIWPLWPFVFCLSFVNNS